MPITAAESSFAGAFSNHGIFPHLQASTVGVYVKGGARTEAGKFDHAIVD